MLIFVFILCFSSCDSFNGGKEKPSTNLEIGEEIIVAEKTISTSGGTVIIDSPGNEVDGLEIVVPANSYPKSKSFKISTAEITNHTLGEYFNPITPLIQIENGGGYADSVMEITIPISISKGEIPLGFYYDEIAGKLEAIPIKKYSKNSITLHTRHFMPASELSPSNLKAGGIKIDPTSNLVISSISESVLKGKAIISSGFRMEVDNWEFVNHGSYISPGGHCAGQNMAAMWYYFEKKLKGEGDLYGKFSTIASIDEDNAIGYRFCSVIQEDLSSEGKVINFFDKYVDKNQGLDEMKFYAIAGAMLTTGEPQGIGIYRTKDNDNNGIPDTYSDGSLKYGGHDLICYQIGVNEGKLYICDPNYPKAGQIIEFENNKFKPYNGKANGNASTYKYPYVTWYAKTAWIDWPQVGKRYGELLDSTIGNKAPNTFPPYTIWVKEKVDQELKNGFTSSSDTLRCEVECPTASRGFQRNGKVYLNSTWVNSAGEKIDVSEGAGKRYTLLKPGVNKIGIYVYSQKSGVVDNNGNFIDKYIDFKWFNVNNSKLEIEPNPVESDVNKDIKFKAKFEGSLPASVKYIWDFGDGNKKQTVLNNNTITYQYKKEGKYDITLELYDNSKNQLIDKASAQAEISRTNDNLAKLKKSKHVEFSGSFDYYTNSPENVFGGAFQFLRSYGYITWEGNSFTITHNYQDSDNTGYKTIWTETVSGTVSADASKLTTFTFDGKREYYYSNKWSSNNIEKITLTNVPIIYAKDENVWGLGTVDHFRYELAKNKVGSSITAFTYGSHGLQWNSDIRDYVDYDWRWDKSHIVEFNSDFTIQFHETSSD